MSEKQIVTTQPREINPHKKVPQTAIKQLETALETARKAEQEMASRRSAAEKELSKMQAVAIKLRQQDDATALELGKLLKNIRETMKALGRGDWTQWYEEAGFKENRVNYCIRVAEGKQPGSNKKDPRGPAPRTPSGHIAWKQFMKAAYPLEKKMFEAACYRSRDIQECMCQAFVQTMEQVRCALESDLNNPELKEASRAFATALKDMAKALWESSPHRNSKGASAGA